MTQGLRHPVVITTMKEDFEKIGLLQEGGGERTIGPHGLPTGQGGPTGTGHPGKNTHPEGGPEDMTMGYETGGDRRQAQSGSRKHKALDYGTTEGEEPEGDEWVEDETEDAPDADAAMAEALEFNEAFDAEWNEMGEQGIATFEIDESDMAEMEGMAEGIVELPGGVIAEDDFEDDSQFYEDAEDEPADEDEPAAPAESSVAEALATIEGIAKSELGTVEEASAAFAQIALMAEQLHGFYQQVADVTEDEDAARIVETFEEMARFSAATVQVLGEDDPESFDPAAMAETLQGYVETLMDGVEGYVRLNEEAESYEDEDEDQDADEEGND